MHTQTATANTITSAGGNVFTVNGNTSHTAPAVQTSALVETDLSLGTQSDWSGGDCLEWIANALPVLFKPLDSYDYQVVHCASE